MKTWMWIVLAVVVLIGLFMVLGGSGSKNTFGSLTGLKSTASKDPWYAQLGSGIGNFFSAWSGTSLQADSSPSSGYSPGIYRGDDVVLGGGDL